MNRGKLAERRVKYGTLGGVYGINKEPVRVPGELSRSTARANSAAWVANLLRALTVEIGCALSS